MIVEPIFEKNVFDLSTNIDGVDLRPVPQPATRGLSSHFGFTFGGGGVIMLSHIFIYKVYGCLT